MNMPSSIHVFPPVLSAFPPRFRPRRLDFQDRIGDGFAARYSKELLVPWFSQGKGAWKPRGSTCFNDALTMV